MIPATHSSVDAALSVRIPQARLVQYGELVKRPGDRSDAMPVDVKAELDAKIAKVIAHVGREEVSREYFWLPAFKYDLQSKDAYGGVKVLL